MDEKEEKIEQQGQEEGTPGEITLDETGELNIPEDFWDDGDPASETKPEPEKPAEPTEPAPPAPTPYTKEELAEAFADGKVDAAKVPPELKEWYEAIEAAGQRRREAQQQTPPPVQPVPQQQPQPQQTPAERYKLARDAAKQIAARNYLGIEAGEIDEFNPQHAAAINQAMQDIRDVAVQMQQQQAAARQKLGEFDAMYREFHAKEPEMERINSEFFPRWLENLPKKEADAVERIIAGGDIGKVRQLLDRVVADYKKGRAPTTPATPPAPVRTPPPVVSTRGAEPDDKPGMVDVSKLGDMTPDEQAEFLLKHKFAEV